MNKEIERIRALSDAFGPSGFEDEVADLVEKNLNDLYETHRDHMCNVTIDAKREDGKPVIMLDAHMDEVGAIVQAVKPNGTMHFLPLGKLGHAHALCVGGHVLGHDIHGHLA